MCGHFLSKCARVRMCAACVCVFVCVCVRTARARVCVRDREREREVGRWSGFTSVFTEVVPREREAGGRGPKKVNLAIISSFAIDLVDCKGFATIAI